MKYDSHYVDYKTYDLPCLIGWREYNTLQVQGTSNDVHLVIVQDNQVSI